MILADMNFMGVDNEGYRYQATLRVPSSVYSLADITIGFDNRTEIKSGINSAFTYSCFFAGQAFTAFPAFVVIRLPPFRFRFSFRHSGVRRLEVAFASVIGARFISGLRPILRHRYLIDFLFQKILYALEVRLFLFVDEVRATPSLLARAVRPMRCT